MFLALFPGTGAKVQGEAWEEWGEAQVVKAWAEARTEVWMWKGVRAVVQAGAGALALELALELALSELVLALESTYMFTYEEVLADLKLKCIICSINPNHHHRLVHDLW